MDTGDLPSSNGRERAISPTSFSPMPSGMNSDPPLSPNNPMQAMQSPQQSLKMAPLSPTHSNHQHYPKPEMNGIDNGYNNSIIGQLSPGMKDMGAQMTPSVSGAQSVSGGDGGSQQGLKDNYETTFDLDGNVETVSTSSYKNEDTKSVGSENR